MKRATLFQAVFLTHVIPRYKDENGWTPMHLAAYWNEKECFRLFIEHAKRHGIDAHNVANRYVSKSELPVRHFPVILTRIAML